VDSASTTFVLGYHGCDASLVEEVLAGRTVLAPSANDFDWLRNGIYFWEHNAQRAYDYAIEVSQQPRHARQKVLRPAVVGAVIDLGLCLNLLDSRFIQMVKQANADFVRVSRYAGSSIPTNRGGKDLLRRERDCAIINFLHATRDLDGDRAFDTVRAVFIEGGRLFRKSGFYAKSHIQLCVRNIGSIKGYFRPLGPDGSPIEFG
jgi:hypothetical protein